MATEPRQIVAVAMNPAIDRVLEVPNLTLGEHQVARLLACYPGGKAVNLAKGLSLLRVPCVLTGFVGEQEYQFFARGVAGGLIRMEMLPVAGLTRQNITLVDPVAHCETHLRDQGFTVSGAELDGLRHKLAALAGPSTLFVFTGSLPPGTDQKDWADLLATCVGSGADVAVDASGPALATAAGSRPWLIKPNQQELEELLGRKTHAVQDLIAAGQDLTRQVEVVLVSCGDRGAYLFTRGGASRHARCPVAPDKVVNTVGCGDALLAGFLAGLHCRYDPAKALRLAVAAAAAAAMGLTPQFDRAQVDACQGQVEMTEL
jgi:1-phosphofructokinase family hexose kinase